MFSGRQGLINKRGSWKTFIQDVKNPHEQTALGENKVPCEGAKCHLNTPESPPDSPSTLDFYTSYLLKRRLFSEV
jgi:hypothetical protein